MTSEDVMGTIVAVLMAGLSAFVAWSVLASYGPFVAAAGAIVAAMVMVLWLAEPTASSRLR